MPTDDHHHHPSLVVMKVQEEEVMTAVDEPNNEGGKWGPSLMPIVGPKTGITTTTTTTTRAIIGDSFQSSFVATPTEGEEKIDDNSINNSGRVVVVVPKKKKEEEREKKEDFVKAVDDLLELVTMKFSRISRDMVGKMDEMAIRLEELEELVKKGKGDEGRKARVRVGEGLVVGGAVMNSS